MGFQVATLQGFLGFFRVFPVFFLGTKCPLHSSGSYPLSLKGSTVGKFRSVCSLSAWLDTVKLFSVCSILALSLSCHFLSNLTALLSRPKHGPVLNLACLSVVCSVWVCLSQEGQWMSFGFWNVLRHTGGWLPFWYKLSLNYLNSIRVFICCAAEGNRKCISGPVMAVLNSFIIFLNCIGCEERTTQVVWRWAAKRRSQKSLQKFISFSTRSL